MDRSTAKTFRKRSSQRFNRLFDEISDAFSLDVSQAATLLGYFDNYQWIQSRIENLVREKQQSKELLEVWDSFVFPIPSLLDILQLICFDGGREFNRSKSAMKIRNLMKNHGISPAPEKTIRFCVNSQELFQHLRRNSKSRKMISLLCKCDDGLHTPSPKNGNVFRSIFITRSHQDVLSRFDIDPLATVIEIPNTGDSITVYTGGYPVRKWERASGNPHPLSSVFIYSAWIHGLKIGWTCGEELLPQISTQGKKKWSKSAIYDNNRMVMMQQIYADELKISAAPFYKAMGQLFGEKAFLREFSLFFGELEIDNQEFIWEVFRKLDVVATLRENVVDFERPFFGGGGVSKKSEMVRDFLYESSIRDIFNRGYEQELEEN